MTNSVSVIIPSYNSEKTIESCLNSINNQNYDGEIEIILIDSSNDNTQKIVSQKFPKVKLYTFDTKTDPGTARNLGVQKSNSEIVFFIDSDCAAPKNWIRDLIKHYKDKETAAVGGSVVPANSKEDFVGWAGYISEFREYIPGLKSGPKSHLPTCNLSYRKSDFNKLNGFNPELYPQEDLYFNHRLTKSGKIIYFDPEIKIRHWHRSDLKPFFKHQYNIGYITSSVLNISDIEGSNLVKMKPLALLVSPLLPFVKFFRTILVFYKADKNVLLNHKKSVFLFFIGLWPWMAGFIKGIIKPKFEENINE